MRICLIDLSSILHTVKHSIGTKTKLSYNEKFTFVIYGFLFRLRNIAVHSFADHIVFAYDSNVSFRKKFIFPEYKLKRTTQEKTDAQKILDELSYPQFRTVKERIIPELGYKNILYAKGYEADDMIARTCLDYPNDEICIVSSDEDMYQLLTPKISIIKPRDFKWYTYTSFKNEYGIEPTDWAKVKTLGGCKSDCVPGLPIPSDNPKVRHIGEGLAIKHILGKVNPETNTHKAFFGPAAEKIIKRNKSLVELPLKGTPKFKIVQDRGLSKMKLISICNEFGFASILKDIDDFSKVLRLR